VIILKYSNDTCGIIVTNEGQRSKVSKILIIQGDVTL
jgi:hypothetical protein